MISDKDILARLQKGESIDDIMKEIEASVNTALSEKKRLDDEAEAKRVAEEQARLDAEKAERTAKYDAVCELLLAVAQLGHAWGWAEIETAVAECDEDDINELVDTIESYVHMFKMFGGGLTFPLGGSKPKVEVKTQPRVETVKVDASDDAITKFLKTHKLF